MQNVSRNGGIGRRTGLKIPRPIKACRFDPDFRQLLTNPTPHQSPSFFGGLTHFRQIAKPTFYVQRLANGCYQYLMEKH